ncbi:MAG: Fe-S cluster assembly protein NifU [Desulfovibrionales bacterium]
MWEYTDKVKEAFLNPKNVGVIKDANGIGEVGSMACGDALKLYLKIDDNGVIQDAKFQTFGCASAIASSSALTELIKGKTVDEALKVTNKEIAEDLGGLPKEKMHCSVMGHEALEAAIRNYRGEEVPMAEPEGEVVCECFGVTDEQIRRSIKDNDLKSVDDVTYFTKAGGGCGQCVEQIEDLLAESRGETATHEKPAQPAMSNLERMRRIEEVVDKEVRPMLQADGGDLQLVDIDRTRVMVSLRGRCTNCPSSQVTIKQGIERVLKEKVDPAITVEEVK